MTIFNNTATSTITFTQVTVDAGNGNAEYTGLMGSPLGVLGGFNFLPGRAELYDYTGQLGQEISSTGQVTVGLDGVDALALDSDLTSRLGNSRSIPAQSFVLGLGSLLDTSTIFLRSASNTVAFSQTLVEVNRVISRTASNTITFTQLGHITGLVVLTASNTVAFTHSHLKAGPVNLTAASPMVFTQNAAPGLISRTASNHLSLTQFAGTGDTDVLTASNTIVFTQTAGPGLLSRTASNHLSLTQLALDSQIIPGAIALTASDTIAFAQTNIRGIIKASAIVLTASSTLTLTHRAIFPVDLTASNIIAFTQSNVSNVGKSATQIITFTQSAIGNVWRSLTAGNTIEFKHGFSAVQFRDGLPVRGLEGCDATKLYAPYSGGDAPVIRPTVPAMERRTDVVFYTPTGPFCTATDSLTLRTPNFGDRDRNKFARINRESRGGSLTIFRDPKWPKERNLVMDFSGIKDSEVDSVIAFLENTLGQEISFRDWNSRVWTGFITNPDSAITRTGVNRNDIALEMEITDGGLSLNACNTIVFTQSNDREVV